MKLRWILTEPDKENTTVRMRIPGPQLQPDDVQAVMPVSPRGGTDPRLGRRAEILALCRRSMLQHQQRIAATALRNPGVFKPLPTCP